ncbi:aldehyde dehydrogenase family protein [Pseudomonas typographi]|uniref:Aldehyde dehydrogenase family protein n=1 Tax=Pseudomonas typographi TaxID=2715964 RepID=A0ABR7Z2R7_9PSED|nr:aldehyde dehydrogenase family protein [Pseudomonas typographi]MBD1599794.1 aldehyde dehydrogenase family protein [Pseudomonas typographi]
MYEDSIQALLPREPAHYIGGQWQASREAREVLNPATEARMGEVAEGDAQTAEHAVSVAAAAQKAWAREGLAGRAQYLQRLLEQVQGNAEGLARLLVTEQGKPIKEARAEVQMALTMLRYHAGLGFRQTGQVMASATPGRTISIREEPYGVVAAIIPWNFPLAMFLRKVAPAIVAGNCIVVKPSENTPFSSLAMATLCHRAGIPAGVVNVVTGPGKSLGEALVRHPQTHLVTMTGSTRAGSQILHAAADKIVPVSLELGGKAPFIVMQDADLQRAAKDAVASRMTNCGQVCIANERTYVHAAIHDRFVEAVVREVQQLQLGDPQADSTDIGPKVSAAERDSANAHLKRALEQGAHLACGGPQALPPALKQGYWVAPTVLTGVAPDAEILKAEVFGPILPIVAFDTEQQVIEWANASEYGLSAYVYTQDLGTAMRLVDELESGEVYINRIGPEEINGFHAGWKRSGLGGDDGEQGYRTYVRTKVTYLDYNA